ncbi:MAG TPA: glutamine amidotransferase [Gammaproteobacteria bacterium]|nr:glutamine amidotransferase [Gammaproteobacteria bacterium]
MKQRTAAVIRHIAFEDAASLGRPLAAAGFEMHYLDASSGRIDVDTAVEADLLVVLGGPIGVGNLNEFPVLHQEIDAIRQRLDDTRPILGICLGAQLIAHALGARITSGAPEIGWTPLTLTTQGREGPLRHFDIPVLHWHNDRSELPADATCLASTASTPNQAFAWRNTLAMQFHPEVTATGLEPWYIGHHRGIVANGLTVQEMRAAGERHAPELIARSHLMFAEWLESIELTQGA